jgi:hypothetical protein
MKSSGLQNLYRQRRFKMEESFVENISEYNGEA